LFVVCSRVETLSGSTFLSKERVVQLVFGAIQMQMLHIISIRKTRKKYKHHSPNFVSNCKRRIISFLRSINLSEFFKILSLMRRQIKGVNKNNTKKYHGRAATEPSAKSMG